MATSRRLDEVFKYSVVLKGLDGAVEIIGALVLLLVSPTRLNDLAQTLLHHHVARDPHDGFIATHILRSTDELAHGGRAFAAAYLLIHGIAKVVLVVALLQRRTWAYPWMIALLGAFIVYQCHRMTYRPSVGLTLLTLFDAFVVWLTWREWRNAPFSAQPVIG